MYTVFDEKNWDSVLLKIGNYDFYHTFKHHFYNSKDDERPMLIVFEDGKNLVAFPFLKRSINDKYFDLTSVHGKVGPISNIQEPNYENERFKKEFENFCLDMNIVSAFSKLNPFLPNQKIVLNGIGEIVCTGENMYFDQKESEEEQLAQYSKSTKKKIRKLEKNAMVREFQSEEDIDFFIKTHYSNMERIGGSDEYYFSKDYLISLLDYDLVDAKILFAVNKENNEIMAGKLNVHTNHIVESEIGWTVEKYRDDSPMALLWNEARKLFRKEGIACINMGGGPGGREGGVMIAKRRYTKNYINFNVWKFIANPQIYHELCSEEQINSDSFFFPKYRS